ncbi:MAG: DUF6232 family protein [Pseudomonadota bacterium]
MEEKTFFSDGGITVTNTRFIVPSQTYAMSGITSVKNSHESPKRSYPIICGVLGLVFLPGALVVGLIIAGVAIVWWLGQKTQYHVVLTTSGGEVKALSTVDGALISKVVQALNDAIVARG